MHLATAKALQHGAARDQHERMAYGYDGQNLPTEMKAKHLEAAAGHRMAQDHFQDAARSYRDGLPMGAKEHEKIAAGAAEKANKLSERLKG